MSKKRICIIGAGPAGLINLATLVRDLDMSEWDVVLYEKSGRFGGAWAWQDSEFTSTSTKFATQFATFVKFTTDDGFFHGQEYGEYLTTFVEELGIGDRINLNSEVTRCVRTEDGWSVAVNDGETQDFNYLILCSGLANRPKRQLDYMANFTELESKTEALEGKTILIVGGGESAVDVAARYSKNNKIVFSLKSGIRLSPRMHPIRGVPSDYMRNELLLRIKETWRNFIGGKFVRFVKTFYTKIQKLTIPEEKIWHTTDEKKRREIELELLSNAKDELYNVFHTKNDDFLKNPHNVEVWGPVIDYTESTVTLKRIARDETTEIRPDYLVNGIGYLSDMDYLGDNIKVADFVYAVVHKSDPAVFLGGFARPVIGNIPTICELQARWICDIIMGKISRPTVADWERDRASQKRKYPMINTDAVYPTDMYPYCETIGRRLRTKKSYRSAKMLLTPFSTLRYFPTEENVKLVESSPAFMPWVFFPLIWWMPEEKIHCVLPDASQSTNQLTAKSTE
jgi:dimethylaniline monooxygenase (N-oxide forming)